MPSASSASVVVQRPGSPEQGAEALGAAAREGQRVRIVGGGTKLGWGNQVAQADLELRTEGLSRLVEHNEGDLTAVVEAGMGLAEAQEAFAAAGQMLSLDPPDPGGATVGGLVATGDSGPMRHRYGAARDLVLGVTAALPDGRLAHAGGRVIKNVAGYDLAKLMCASYGTLGVIVEVVLRLHPRPAATASVGAPVATADELATGAAALARAPLELLSLDVAWHEGRGAVLARAAGSAALDAAQAAGRVLLEAGLEAELHEDDEALWEEQRAGQRAGAGVRDDGERGSGYDDAKRGSGSNDGEGGSAPVNGERGDGGEAVVRISGRPDQLAEVASVADEHGARVVGRAALGLFWLTLPAGDPAATLAAIGALRGRLSPSPCVVLDAPEAVRASLDPWGVGEGAELALGRRLKARFDPQGTCNPGLFVGGM